MELGEIIKDALVYPINNVVSLAIYIVLGIVLGDKPRSCCTVRAIAWWVLFIILLQSPFTVLTMVISSVELVMSGFFHQSRNLRRESLYK